MDDNTFKYGVFSVLLTIAAEGANNALTAAGFSLVAVIFACIAISYELDARRERRDDDGEEPEGDDRPDQE